LVCQTRANTRAIAPEIAECAASCCFPTFSRDALPDITAAHGDGSCLAPVPVPDSSESDEFDAEFGDFDDETLAALWDACEAEAEKAALAGKQPVEADAGEQPPKPGSPSRHFPDFASFARSAKDGTLAKNLPMAQTLSKLAQARRGRFLNHSRIQPDVKQPRKEHGKPDTPSASDGSADDSEGNGLQQLATQRKPKPNLLDVAAAAAKQTRLPEINRSIKLVEEPIVESPQLHQRRAHAIKEELDRARIAPNLDKLHAQVLSWPTDPAGDTPPSPPAGPEIKYQAVPATFSSTTHYQKIFEPLLVLECWQQLQSAFEEGNPTQDSVDATCASRATVDCFSDVTFTMAVGPARTLAEHDLVLLSRNVAKPAILPSGVPVIQSSSSKPDACAILGKVNSVTTRSDIGDVRVRVYSRGGNEALALLNPKTSWKILKLFSLVPVHREYAALQGMAYYGLSKDILNPKQAATPQPRPSADSIARCVNTYGVNEPQAVAILSALGRKKGFTLIQGVVELSQVLLEQVWKTKTILGLVGALLSQESNESQVGRTTCVAEKRGGTGELNGVSKFQFVLLSVARIHGSNLVRLILSRYQSTFTTIMEKPRLLICAPSNAAVDEIVKRIRLGVVDFTGVLRSRNVVRVGVSDQINSAVRDVTLDYLTEQELSRPESLFSQAEQAQEKAVMTSEQIREAKEDVSRKIEEVKLAISKQDGSTSEMEERLASLKRQLWELYRKQDREKEKKNVSRVQRENIRKETRNRILAEADIVCCTLSGSGHDVLASLPTGFETVIIDEAAQSVRVLRELD
ncbi:MAG: AAA domain-containing protein, partial [Olpidium bornovanus]